MAKMKDKAIVGNIGHFDNEIDMAGLAKVKGVVRNQIKPQYDEWKFPDGHSVMVLAEGRLLNLGCATGHPSFVMSASFSNQTIAQLELYANRSKYEKKVYILPKHLDEKVARLHLGHLGVKLTQLTKEQAEYPRRTGRGSIQARSLSGTRRKSEVQSRKSRSRSARGCFGDPGLFFFGEPPATSHELETARPNPEAFLPRAARRDALKFPV